MDWSRVAESHPVLVSTLAGFGGCALALLGNRCVALFGFKAEVMRLRHSITERRVREFDRAAGDLFRMLLAVPRGGEVASKEFTNRHPIAALEVSATASLVAISGAGMGSSLSDDLIDSCHRLCMALLANPLVPGGGVPPQLGEAWVDAGSALVAFMHYVDISAEARLEGRLSRRHAARLGRIARNQAEWREKAAQRDRSALGS